MSNPPGPRTKRVAVIAVHGVGHHEPHRSAHDMAELLLRVPREGPQQYTSFTEHCVSIPTRRVPEHEHLHRPDGESAARKGAGHWSHLNERPSATASSETLEPEPIDVAFMRGQLRDYTPRQQDGVYETVRIEGRRMQGEGATRSETDIHIYEMFWSDISQIGKSIFGVFGAFYQLVIHLPYVGGWTLQQVPHDSGAGWAKGWRVLRSLYTGALRALTLFAPTLNIILLALGTSLLTRHVPEGARPLVAKVVPAVVLLALAIWLMSRKTGRRGGWQIGAPLLVAALPLLVPSTAITPHVDWILVVEWWLIAALPLWVVFSAFQRNRPFARTLGIAVYLVSSAVLAGYGRNTPDPGVAVLHTAEWLGLGLQLTWFTFGLCLLGVIVLGVSLAKLATEESRTRVRRAAYTARFALAFPAVAFSVATLLVWGGLVAAESETAFGNQPYEHVSQLQYPALDRHRAYDARRIDRSLDSLVAVKPTDTAQFNARTREFDELTREKAQLPSAGYFLGAFWGSSDTVFGVVGTMLIGLSLIIVVAALMPVVVTELKSPPTPPPARERTAFDARSVRLGYWLSFAFRASRIAGELLGVTCLLSLLALFIVIPVLNNLLPDWGWLTRTVESPLGISYRDYGTLVASGAGTLGALALFGRLSQVGLGMRPVVGIAVDVDNYLRELPGDRTPRARMAERYTSLLRYLCAWRAVPADPSSGYDAIVIVAHSQGTVITADLLRYLAYEKAQNPRFETRLERLAAGASHPLPIALFTMGCPLRQLYALRFPHLYGWVGYDVTSGPELRDMLGVRSWLNVYRSGDYVGRALWRDDDQSGAAYTPFDETQQKDEDATELCVGPGAHTHYWDETADEIAVRLDRILAAPLGAGSLPQDGATKGVARG
jgi:hypothetical protein